MEDTRYSGGTVALAAIGTVCFPYAAVIAAVLLVGRQTDPHRRAQLRAWAWLSGGWLAIGGTVAVLLAVY